MESENDIMREIHTLAKAEYGREAFHGRRTFHGKRTVILISHRLANVTGSDNIYVMDKGNIVERGRHEELLAEGGVYKELWNAQQSLENYGKGGAME